MANNNDVRNCDFVRNYAPYYVPPHFTTETLYEAVKRLRPDIPKQTVLCTISRMKRDGQILTVLKGARNVNGKSGGSEKDILKLRIRPKDFYYIWNGQRDPKFDKRMERESSGKKVNLSVPYLLYKYTLNTNYPFLKEGSVNDVKYYLQQQTKETRDRHTLIRQFKLCAGEGTENYNGVVFIRKATQQEIDKSYYDLFGTPVLSPLENVKKEIGDRPIIPVQMELPFPNEFTRDYGLTQLITTISSLFSNGDMNDYDFENFHALISDNDKKSDLIDDLKNKLQECNSEKESLEKKIKMLKLELASFRINNKGRIKLNKSD